jgi:hypothetical protein
MIAALVTKALTPKQALQQARAPPISTRASTRSSAGSERCPPKAEVTGSNPVGCANDFDGLRDSCEGSGLDNFRIILVAMVPLSSDLKIARIEIYCDWETGELAGKDKDTREGEGFSAVCSADGKPLSPRSFSCAHLSSATPLQ